MDATIYVIAFAGLICFLLWKNHKADDSKDMHYVSAASDDGYGNEEICVFVFYEVLAEGFDAFEKSINYSLSDKLNELKDNGRKYFTEFITLGAGILIVVIHIKPESSKKKGGLGLWTKQQ